MRLLLRSKTATSGCFRPTDTVYQNSEQVTYTRHVYDIWILVCGRCLRASLPSVVDIVHHSSHMSLVDVLPGTALIIRIFHPLFSSLNCTIYSWMVYPAYRCKNNFRVYNFQAHDRVYIRVTNRLLDNRLSICPHFSQVIQMIRANCPSSPSHHSIHLRKNS